MAKLTYKEVWKTLGKVNLKDVGGKDYTETRKGKFTATYLPWAFAWEVLMNNYPDARVEWKEWEVETQSEKYTRDVLTYDDRTCMVECTIWIGDLHRTMWLPVYDFKHDAVANPNSHQINTAKQRCFVKCLAMYGLGHYIFAGEDVPTIPEETKPKTKPKAKPKPKAKTKKVEEPKDVTYDDLSKVMEDTLDSLAEKDERETMIGFLNEHKDADFLNDKSRDALNKFLEKSDNQTTEIIETWYDRLKEVVDNNKEK